MFVPKFCNLQKLLTSENCWPTKFVDPQKLLTQTEYNETGNDEMENIRWNEQGMEMEEMEWNIMEKIRMESKSSEWI